MLENVDKQHPAPSIRVRVLLAADLLLLATLTFWVLKGGAGWGGIFLDESSRFSVLFAVILLCSNIVYIFTHDSFFSHTRFTPWVRWGAIVGCVVAAVDVLYVVGSYPGPTFLEGKITLLLCACSLLLLPLADILERPSAPIRTFTLRRLLLLFWNFIYGMFLFRAGILMFPDILGALLVGMLGIALVLHSPLFLSVFRVPIWDRRTAFAATFWITGSCVLSLNTPSDTAVPATFFGVVGCATLAVLFRRMMQIKWPRITWWMEKIFFVSGVGILSAFAYAHYDREYFLYVYGVFGLLTFMQIWWLFQRTEKLEQIQDWSVVLGNVVGVWYLTTLMGGVHLWNIAVSIPLLLCYLIAVLNVKAVVDGKYLRTSAVVEAFRWYIVPAFLITGVWIVWSFVCSGIFCEPRNNPPAVSYVGSPFYDPAFTRIPQPDGSIILIPTTPAP